MENVTIPWRFRGHSPTLLKGSDMETAVSQLYACREGCGGPRIDWLGRPHCYEVQPFVFFVFHTGSRPPADIVVVWDSVAMSWLLPGKRDKDFYEIADRLSLDIEQMAYLHDVVHCGWAALYKGEVPHRIASVDDAAAVGIDASVIEGMIPADQSTLWWSRWGGSLYLLSFERPRIYVKVLKTGVGHYRRLIWPFWPMRWRC